MSPAEIDWKPVRDSIARAVRALTERAVRAVPDRGGFEFADESFEVESPAWKAGAVTLRIGAVPQPAPQSGPTDQRYVQVRIATPSGRSQSSRWLTAGSKAGLIAFLESSAAVEQVLATMLELAESQRQQGLP